MDTVIWIKGETIDLIIPVARDGVLQDISTATIVITLRVRRGAEFEELGQWTATPRTQTGADLGYADAVIPSDALLDVDAGTYWRDIVAIFPGDPPVRRWVERPRKVDVQDAVYQPPPA